MLDVYSMRATYAAAANPDAMITGRDPTPEELTKMRRSQRFTAIVLTACGILFMGIATIWRLLVKPGHVLDDFQAVMGLLYLAAAGWQWYRLTKDRAARDT